MQTSDTEDGWEPCAAAVIGERERKKIGTGAGTAAGMELGRQDEVQEEGTGTGRGWRGKGEGAQVEGQAAPGSAAGAETERRGVDMMVIGSDAEEDQLQGHGVAQGQVQGVGCAGRGSVEDSVEVWGAGSGGERGHGEGMVVGAASPPCSAQRLVLEDQELRGGRCEQAAGREQTDASSSGAVGGQATTEQGRSGGGATATAAAAGQGQGQGQGQGHGQGQGQGQGQRQRPPEDRQGEGRHAGDSSAAAANKPRAAQARLSGGQGHVATTSLPRVRRGVCKGQEDLVHRCVGGWKRDVCKAMAVARKCVGRSKVGMQGAEKASHRGACTGGRRPW